MKTKDHEAQECRIIDLETVILDMLEKKKVQDDKEERHARRIEELEAGIRDCMIDLAGLIEKEAGR